MCTKLKTKIAKPNDNLKFYEKMKICLVCNVKTLIWVIRILRNSEIDVRPAL